MFVFRHLNENLLGFAQRDLSLKLIKRILECALQGLAALHEQDLVHNDIKANNIMIQTKECSRDADVEQVQLVDLEDTVHLPPGRAIMGIEVGNWMWRSPEAHAQGPVEKPSDMFSFGLVCIYAMTQRVVLAVDESELLEGEEKLAIVLERQLSYFADESGYKAFLQYIGAESPWHEIFRVINSGFGKDQPRKPFALWKGKGLDDDFKAFIGGLTDFDPARRMSAQQALAHRWLENV
ncbi:calcium/calmodulin dependent protein kinase [Zymoseptoria brevis]|uniref:Calcium/calmodulin dependent protein kinase n=1 Tax=Zymoseptoria brevis TaxID=1047168 RepID=A0A0F4GTE5_9PEZI|nr:calcium/calmodulin dependent protein kinase [Zymoseptoria brevis]